MAFHNGKAVLKNSNTEVQRISFNLRSVHLGTECLLQETNLSGKNVAALDQAFNSFVGKLLIVHKALQGRLDIGDLIGQLTVCLAQRNLVQAQRFNGSGTGNTVLGLVHPRALASVPACTRPKASNSLRGARGSARQGYRPLVRTKTKTSSSPVSQPGTQSLSNCFTEDNMWIQSPCTNVVSWKLS